MKTLLLFFSMLSTAALCRAQTTIETVPVKQLVPTGSLATCTYRPSDEEAPYYKKLAKDEIITGSMFEGYTLHGKTNKYVSWYGIVRGVRTAGKKPDTYELLLEQKYFDGMSDCHIMLVSKSGAGDFLARVTTKDSTIPALALVRIYGKVVSETKGVALIEAEYVRVWPWFTFTLTDLGPDDQSNPLWTKFCRPCQSQARLYKPYPTEDYYLAILGDPKDFGKMLPAADWPK